MRESLEDYDSYVKSQQISGGDVLYALSTMPLREFERAVRRGGAALVNRLFGLPRGALVRLARFERKFYALERGMREGFAEQQKSSLYKRLYGGGK